MRFYYLTDATELFGKKEGGIEIRRTIGDISDRETVRCLIDRDDMSVFHLASVVTGVKKILTLQCESILADGICQRTSRARATANRQFDAVFGGRDAQLCRRYG